jgi:hypothetical protein
MVSQIELGGRDYILSGWGLRSQWVQNILQDPLVTVQAYQRRYTARIRRVTDREEFARVAERILQTGGDSHFKPWLASQGIDHSAQDLTIKRDRVYLFGFDREDQPGPEPLRTDLAWIHLPLLGIIAGIIWLLTS